MQINTLVPNTNERALLNVFPHSSLSTPDNVFGRCEQWDKQTDSYASTFTYKLDRKTLQLLEKELNRLYEQGYTWTDEYCQCILNTILNDRPRIVYDSSKCDRYGRQQTVAPIGTEASSPSDLKENEPERNPQLLFVDPKSSPLDETAEADPRLSSGKPSITTEQLRQVRTNITSMAEHSPG